MLVAEPRERKSRSTTVLGGLGLGDLCNNNYIVRSSVIIVSCQTLTVRTFQVQIIGLLVSRINIIVLVSNAARSQLSRFQQFTCESGADASRF